MIALLRCRKSWLSAAWSGSAAMTAFLLVASGSAAAAQQPAASPPLTSPPILANPSSGGGNLVNLLASAPYQFWLSCLIVAFGLAIIGGLMWSLMKVSAPKAEDISRPMIVVTVIIGSLILVSAGYSNSQIAPAFGLFGTIIGYMLGRISPNSGAAPPGEDDEDTPPSAAPAAPASVGGGVVVNAGNDPADAAAISNSPGRRSIEP
jgi:hypothetical protein